jgi:hypothetical protein
MPEALPTFEAQRVSIQQRISQFGDMRAGWTTTTSGRAVIRSVIAISRMTPVIAHGELIVEATTS